MVGAALAFGQDTAPSDAAKKTADDLAKKLIKNEPAAKDVMSRIVTRMSEVEDKLARGYDPGAQTQEVQKAIVKELERAIASSIRKSRNRPQDQPEGDVRRKSKDDQRPADRTGASDARPDEADTVQVRVDEGEKEKADRPRETQRAWGHLPPREREEVIQGAGEESLDKFREWIERYYKALAEDPR